ncbi:IclR family transcriptional regulator [Nocardia salmonicida]|uniref:IclR family transcriptional regulator n=1 Tax=Nocardia salmonicida TaxID=53431 RepID=UPI0036877842
MAERAGLARPTAHRLLTALAQEGVADRESATGRWSPGPELFFLGSVAARRYDIAEQAQPILRRLSQSTGESAFLSARRGDETVCIAAEEGSFPLRSHVLHVGIRLPLGGASAGLAILAHMPDREITSYLSQLDITDGWGPAHTNDAIASRLNEIRSLGYSVNPGLIVEGSWGIGAVVFDHRGEPGWALSITGVESRFTVERRARLGELLLDHAHQLTTILRDRPRPTTPPTL